MRTHAAVWILTGVAVTSMLLFTVAWADGAQDPAGGRPAPDGRTGADVYRQNCQACHGPDAVGTATAPSLRDVLERLSSSEARAVIEHGRNNMPSFRHLQRAEVDALIVFLRAGANEGGVPAPEVPLPNLTEEQIGERIYRSNCASCHSSQPVGRMCGAPSLVNVTQRLGREQIAGLVRRGSCRMPSFEHFTDAEIGALHAYLMTLERDGAPVGRRGCGLSCRSCRGVGAPRPRSGPAAPQPRERNPAPRLRRRGCCCG